jgi:hypothetical protein
MDHWVAHPENAVRRFEKWVERQSPGALDTTRQYTQRMRAAKVGLATAAKAAGEG